MKKVHDHIEDGRFYFEGFFEFLNRSFGEIFGRFYRYFFFSSKSFNFATFMIGRICFCYIIRKTIQPYVLFIESVLC